MNNMKYLKLFGLVLLICLFGVSVNGIDAQCIDEPCPIPKEIIEKLFHSQEQHNIKNIRLYNYDNNGNVIEQMNLNKNGEFIMWTKIVYDEDNNKIEQKIYQSPDHIRYAKYDHSFSNNLKVITRTGSDGIIIGMETFLFDDKNRIIKNQDFIPERTISTETYDYNNDGKVSEYQRYMTIIENMKTFINSGYDMSGLITKYEYDESGNMIKSINSGMADESNDIIHTYEYENGKLISDTLEQGFFLIKDKYEYDDKGNLIKEELKNPFDNTESSLLLYTYNENDKIIEKKLFQYEKNIPIPTKYNRDTYEYDKNNNMIDRKQFSRYGDLKLWHQFAYNDNGNLTKWIYYDTKSK